MSRWQDELKSVDGPDSRMVFTMEPAAATLPGMTIHNIQLSVLTRPAYGEQPSIWARKRSQGIEFYPVLLGTAASEIDPTNEEPLEAAIWCAAEQASSGRGHCQAHIKSCGTVLYIHSHKDHASGREVGPVQPQVDYLSELELPAETRPGAAVDEVESFQPCEVDRIEIELTEGLYHL